MKRTQIKELETVARHSWIPTNTLISSLSLRASETGMFSIPVRTSPLIYQHANSPYNPRYISFGNSWENLFKNQVSSSLMIIHLILMTCMFVIAMVL